ncbi:hypothetical protein TELCIR_16359 [Teladorsagia circumcincta]|uniref:Uncharacterized protein n=1 Tax=Teladorsagia circumcincta TaxID=45464 RepID=A0A2G9TVQ2_TELCI|nr:hypothetical protein TELCIR_16359 [Teladorsagia circumcincta]
MNNQREKIGSPQPLEIYCGPSSTYLPYMVSSPQDRPGETISNWVANAPFTARLDTIDINILASTQFSPNYTMVESGHDNGVVKVLPQSSYNGECLFSSILELICSLKA